MPMQKQAIVTVDGRRSPSGSNRPPFHSGRQAGERRSDAAFVPGAVERELEVLEPEAGVDVSRVSYLGGVARKKEMLKKRDRFQTQFACLKTAEMLCDGELEQPRITRLRVEDYASGAFDDVVEFRRRADGGEDKIGWQIKNHARSFPVEIIMDLLADLAKHRDLSRGILGLARFVPVKGGGDFSTLAELCRRASAPGVDLDALTRSLGKDERRWLEYAPADTGNTLRDKLALLARFGVSELGDEAAILQHTDDYLMRAFGATLPGLRDSIEAWIQSINGATNITVPLIESEVLEHYRAERPGIITRTRRRSARRQYLDAITRAAKRLRPLHAVSHQLFANTRDLTLAGVYVKPTVFTGSECERPLDGIPLDRVLAPGARVAVIGDLGTGKTVALETIRSQLAENAIVDPTAPIPVLVHARSLVDGSWREALAARVGLPRDQITAVLKSHWLLLADGVDEVGSTAWDSIDDISHNDDKCVGVVASSRPTALPPYHSSFDLLRLSPWRLPQLEQFLENWERRDPDAVERVRAAIKAGSLRHALLINPLIATLCICVASVDRELPRSRSGLLRRVASLLFEEWRRLREPSAADLRWSQVVRPLGHLAIEYLSGGGRPLAADRVWRALREVVPHEEYAVQREAELHLGILVPGPDQTFDFVLRPLAEYLAGEVIAEMDDDRIAGLVATPWALESMRVALTLLADLGQVDRAVALIERIAAATMTSLPGADAGFLRSLILAIRVAAELGDAIAPAAERLVAAIVHVVTDETSSWVGEVVAEEARALAVIGGPCWDPLLARLRPFARRFNEEPAGWYAAQAERPAAYWMMALLHPEADVRAIAIEKLTSHVDQKAVQRRLAVEIRDEGYVLGGIPPAVQAGDALRRASRGAEFDRVREMLLAALNDGDPLTSAAAAVALRPSEAELSSLVSALRTVAASFTVPVPPHVIAELADTPAGEQALDEGWPDWRDPRFQQAPFPRPSVLPHEPRPPSHPVRERISKLLALALPRLTDDDLRLFTPRSQYVRDHMLIEALDEDSSVAGRLDLRHIPLDAQVKFGEAARRSTPLRDRLIAFWEDPDLPLPSAYPGIALEPLVEGDDNEAATLYARWLPSSPYALIQRSALARPRPGVLRHPIVLEAVRALAVRLIDEATVGRPDGSRPWKPAVGNTLNPFAPAWCDDPSIVRRLHDWLRADDEEAFNGALWALWGIPLTPDIKATAEGGFRKRLAVIHEREELGEGSHDARDWLIWIDEMRITAPLRAQIMQLVKPSTDIGCVAGAVVLPLLDPAHAAALSTEMAPLGVTLDEHLLHGEFLRRYVLAAETAWTAAAIAAIEHGMPVTGSSGLQLMEWLSAEHRAMVAEALLQSPVSRAELHWTRSRGDDLRCVRPADIVRRIAFDLGL